MRKTPKFIVGVSLMAQSFTSFVMFLVFLNKKKGLSKTFLTLGIIGFIGALWSLWSDYKDELSELKCDCDECIDGCDCDSDFIDDTSADDITFSITDSDSDVVKNK